MTMEDTVNKRTVAYWKQQLMSFFDISLFLSVWKDTDKDVIYSVLLTSLAISVLSLVFPLMLLQVYDRIIPHKSTSTLFWLFAGVSCAVLLSAGLKIVRVYVGAWADAKFEHRMGCRAFNAILNSQLSQYEKEGAGRHLKRMTSLQMLKQFYAGQALVSLVDIPFIVVCFLLIIYIGGWLVFVPILIVLVSVWLTFSNNVYFQSLLKERQSHDDRRLNFVLEIISKIQTIKSNTMEAQMLRRYERLQKTASVYDYKLTERSAYLMSDSIVFSQLAVILIVVFGSIMVFNGEFTVGALAACSLLAGQCMQPINALLHMWNRMQTIRIAHAELDKVLTLQPETQTLMPSIERPKGQIIFEDVSFRFYDDSPWILRHCNITIDPRQMICITGEQATGKSLIFSLMLRLANPTEGRILLDGTDIALIDPDSLRTVIGYMPQTAVLFKGTILENLVMFDMQLEARAKELCKAIGLSKIVEGFPDGYDTRVASQTSDTLPRGLQQQIVIVRALIRDPMIILFDEANITIDLEGDKRIRELLQKLKGNRTILIASYRPSILGLADKQYILEEGQLKIDEKAQKAQDRVIADVQKKDEKHE